MKFPRHARIYRGHLDATPFAGVFFCLLIFILLASLVYTPGVLVTLPDSATPLPGVDGPTLAVAVDPNGGLYFQDQIIEETNLFERLQAEVAKQSEPLTLILLADRKVTVEQENHLRDIASKAGVRQLFYAVRPRVFDPPAQPEKP